MNLEKAVLGERNSQRTHAIHFHYVKGLGKENPEAEQRLVVAQAREMENGERLLTRTELLLRVKIL